VSPGHSLAKWSLPSVGAPGRCLADKLINATERGTSRPTEMRDWAGTICPNSNERRFAWGSESWKASNQASSTSESTTFQRRSSTVSQGTVSRHRTVFVTIATENCRNIRAILSGVENQWQWFLTRKAAKLISVCGGTLFCDREKIGSQGGRSMCTNI